MSEPLLYTPKEAAARLGTDFKESWLRKQAAARAIPCTYLGKRKLRFSEQNLLDLVAMFNQTLTGAGTRSAR